MLLIDGDIIAYRVLFSKDAETLGSMYSIVETYINNIITNADPDIKRYKVYLTGKGNFRDDIAVTVPYKGNRPSERPEGLEDIRQYILLMHPSELVEGQEADDKIAIEATLRGEACVVCSIDKDLDQIPGKHFNFVKNIQYSISPQQGLLNFYCQILTGDRVDNIVGLKGVGPKTALKALKDCKTELEMYQKCLEMYEDEQRVIENARLLWLRRQEGQQWNPPAATKTTEAQVSEETQQPETTKGL